jgi:hypothetical protein
VIYTSKIKYMISQGQIDLPKLTQSSHRFTTTVVTRTPGHKEISLNWVSFLILIFFFFAHILSDPQTDEAAVDPFIKNKTETLDRSVQSLEYRVNPFHSGSRWLRDTADNGTRASHGRNQSQARRTRSSTASRMAIRQRTPIRDQNMNTTTRHFR